MNIRKKVVLLATLPLILIVLLSSFLMKYQYDKLANQQLGVFQESLYNSKYEELKNYTELALSSVETFYNSTDIPTDKAKQYAKNILTNLAYGEHGYFFVYDFQGNNMVHPKQPFRLGENWINLKDSSGNYVIKDLIKITQNGGGYYTYKWDNPATGTEDDKRSYNLPIEDWGWFVGTGLYLDEIDAQILQQKIRFEDHITTSLVQNALLMLVAILSVFILTFYMNFHELGQADEDLKRLNQEIISAQEDERARVSRELHDGISQTLVTVKYYFERALLLTNNSQHAPDPGVETCLKDGLAALLSATKDVRRISHDLRPIQLDALGLAAAIENLVEEFEKQTKIKITTDIPNIKETLPRSSKTSLFRICQEALTNVEKHAHATHVAIKARKDQHYVTLQISDNGVGMENTTHFKGLGFQNMRERVAALNGRFDIKTGHKGTSLTIKIPLHAPISEKVEHESV